MWALLLASFFFTSVASAANIEVNYQGVLISMNYLDCTSYDSSGECSFHSDTPATSSDLLNGQMVAVGQPFDGGFSYYSSRPLADTFSYDFYGRSPTATLTTGQVSLPEPWLPQVRNGGFVDVRNWDSEDHVFFQALFRQDGWWAVVDLYLTDSTGKALDNISDPADIDFYDFDTRHFHISFVRESDGDQLTIYGQLNAVAFSSAVPEPSTVSLFLVGLAALSRRHREA